MVRACTEKRRRIRRQESDGDGGAEEKKERKTIADSTRNDLSESREDTQDRTNWRRLIRHIDPT